MRAHIIAIFCCAIISYAARAESDTGTINLSVKGAIEIGIKNHPGIQKSKIGIEAANGNYWREISLPAPSLSLESEFIPDGLGISHYDERSLEISQDFEFPTVYFSKAALAGKKIDAAKSELEIATNSLANNIKRAYFSAVEKLALLNLAKENLELAAEFSRKAEIKVKVGEGTNLELLTAKVQLTETKSTVSTAEKDYKTALNDLNLSMGYNSGDDLGRINFTDTLGLQPRTYNFDELLARSYQRNSTLQRAAYELQSAEISKKIAWMGLLPTFSASYMFQSKAMQLNDNPGYSSNYHGFRLSVNLPLWFMFDQKGRIQEADAAYRVNEYNEQIAKNELRGKIASAYEEYKNSIRQLELYRDELIPQAEEIFRTADISYKAGEISYLEFLQAKLTAINAKINSIKIQFDYKESIVRLEEASGLTLE